MSKKFAQRMIHPHYVGHLMQQPSMQLLKGTSGDMATGSKCTLYALVEKETGLVADARFQLFGDAVLVGLLDTTCEMMIGKKLAYAKALTADAIEKAAKSPESVHALNLIIDTIIDLCAEAEDVVYIAPPTSDQRLYPHWEKLSREEKMAAIGKLLEEEVQPYIALDAGGVKLIDLVGNRATIAYEGTCTSCYSAIGSTLEAIRSIVQARLSPDLEVQPDLTQLKLH